MSALVLGAQSGRGSAAPGHLGNTGVSAKTRRPRLRPSLPKWTQQPPPGFGQSAGGERGTAPKNVGTRSSAPDSQEQHLSCSNVLSTLPPNLLLPASQHLSNIFSGWDLWENREKQEFFWQLLLLAS